MASSLVDNLAVRALHEHVCAALISGSAPWFAELLRRPEEIGDFSDKGRRINARHDAGGRRAAC